MKFLLTLTAFFFISIYSNAQLTKDDFKSKQTYLLGIDSILDNRALDLFLDTWKLTKVSTRSEKSDKELLADTSNFIIARTMVLDEGGKSRYAISLIKGGLDTSKVAIRPDGFLQFDKRSSLLISQLVNPQYLDSYSGVLYYQALWSRVNMTLMDNRKEYFTKILLKNYRKQGLDKVYVRGSQLDDAINTPGAVKELSQGLALHWERKLVEQALRERNTRVGFVDVVVTKDGDGFRKNVEVFGVNGLIYETSSPSDNKSTKLRKDEFRQLMDVLVENQPRK